MKHRAGHVALVGRPNVGKSTLLNRLLGQKLAITSHKPQTTRHSILGINTLDDGQIVYIDTPGIHQRGDKAMNRYLNRTATSVLAGVDLVVMLVDSSNWTDEDEMVLQRVHRSKLPLMLVVNKIDTLKQREDLLPLLASLSEKTGIETVIPISARNGDNCDHLEDTILQALPEGDNFYAEDQITDRPERFFAAELIREQITRRYHKELPYSATVEIEEFDVQPHIYRISAIIWVERQNQKGILVGKGGQALKETATEARKELQKFFQNKVYLRLWVKVKKSWSADQASLSRLGYSD
ncbi:GTPase Era [Thiolapillus brandeum]|uniref:GTPase Era n=1 Tax=Thiolapillus brandeum TaxID=1076588 RepID=A0A7U6GI33_9GAMM|nr:GTPase Era [Thiolapillus brandeum]BAO44058.1 GTP-binding protein Era [Thiolapillus brandeum]